MRMGEEVLRTGKLNVYRDDREELLMIRNGAWEYGQLIEWADNKTKEIELIVRNGESVVPKNVNLSEIASLSIVVKSMFLNRNK